MTVQKRRREKPMTWFVASLRDEDTHLSGKIVDGSVTTWCGRSFRPLARLTGSPLDPLQVCPTCAQSQQGPSSAPSQD